MTKPFDLQVYDTYLQYLDHMLTVGRTLAEHPFDELLGVCDRMDLTGRYYAPGAQRAVVLTPELVAAQRHMIEAARAFRDAVMGPMDPTQQATAETVSRE